MTETDFDDQMQTAKALLDLSTGNGDLRRLVQQTAHRPDACYAAFLTGYQEKGAERRSEFGEALDDLPPPHGIKDRQLYVRLVAFMQEMEESRRGDREPGLVTSQYRATAPPSMGERLPFREARKTRNPFPFKMAEADEGNLFTMGAIWLEHPIGQRLFNVPGPAMISGELGSGRTAMALALERYQLSRNYLKRYVVAGRHWEQRVREQLARALLGHTVSHPTQLGGLDRAELETLAAIFNELGTPNVLALIAGEERDLGVRILQEKDEFENFAMRLGAYNLGLLKDVIEETDHTIGEHQFPSTFAAAVRLASFFEHAILLLDLSSTWDLPITEKIVPQLERWRHSEIIIYLFVSRPQANVIDSLMPTTRFDLTWTDTEMDAMLRHRVNKLVDSEELLDLMFEDDAYRYLMEKSRVGGSPNPGRWIALWNQIVEYAPPNTPKITRQLIDEALAS